MYLLIPMKTLLWLPNLKEMGKDVAMQIAAMSPAYSDRTSVPASVIEHESEIIKAQLAEDPEDGRQARSGSC